MAAEYTNVTVEEMREFLSPLGFSQVGTLFGTQEYVFAKRVDFNGHKLSLRVYTGINPDGNSRDVGADAIRCAIFWRKPDDTVAKVASSKRVNRVKNWRVNLQDRIDSLVVGPNCPACSSPMVERKGKNGVFYGCGNFPECRQTKKKED